MELIAMTAPNEHALQLFSEHDDFMIGCLGDDKIYYTRYSEKEGLERIWLAYEGDLPMGCIAFREKTDGVGEVKRLFIRDRYRGKGLSKLLLSTLVSYARDQGCQKLYLDTRTELAPAVGLYRSFGFDVIFQQGFYVQMEMELSNG